MRFASLIMLLLAIPSPAFAHASDRGFVLLLPTGHYILGGAVAVAISFAVLAFVPSKVLTQVWSQRVELFRIRYDLGIFTSLASFMVLAILMAAGFLGSRDPLSNPLPLSVWTLFWIGLTLVCGVFGNVWRWVDPWYGVLTILGVNDLRRDSLLDVAPLCRLRRQRGARRNSISKQKLRRPTRPTSPPSSNSRPSDGSN